MDGEDDTSDSDLDEGGPVKSFLDHLEDFRWVLIKCVVTVLVTMLICLLGARYVIGIIKWPMTHDQIVYAGKNPVARTFFTVYNGLTATVSFPGTNHIALVNFGTNHLGKFQLEDGQALALHLDPANGFVPAPSWTPATIEKERALYVDAHRFVEIQVQPVTLGTNQVLGWQTVTGPTVEVEARKMHVDLVNLSPAGAFFVAVQVAFYGGMVLAAPLLVYFITTFVFPALKIHEKKHAFRAMLFGGGLFLVGVFFCYFVLMPVALVASQKYSEWLGLGAFEWRAEDYISFVCKFLLGMGLGFELPVVILTLVKIGILNYRTLRSAWRYMIVINLILGAVLTTPEVVTQVLMAVPLYLLYEITVWIAWYWEWRDRKRGLSS